MLLFALSGLFGKWLTVSPIIIVFGRAFFAAIAITSLLLFFSKQSIAISRRFYIPMLATGAVLAFHWVTFFYAIQLSTVAIGLITFACFPIFVSLLAPVFFKEKFHLSTLFQALLTLVGISLVIPFEGISDNTLLGGVLGILSALSFAILTLLNRKYVVSLSAKHVALYQNAVASICLIPFFGWLPMAITANDLLLLALLGIVFTAFAHSLFNHSLKQVKAQTASIAVSLEPIYGIVAAYFLLGEQMTYVMMLGGALVIIANVWAIRTD